MNGYIRQFPDSQVRGVPRQLLSDEELRKQSEAMQDRIEKSERIRLARDLLVAGRVSTVAEAFELADTFADEALRRLPHDPYNPSGIGIGIF